MYVAAAAGERRDRAEHRQAGRHAEHHDQSVVEGGRDQVWEELGPGQDVLVSGGDRRQRPGGCEQVRHRVLAEDGGEHRGHGREARHVLGDGVRDALLLEAG